MSRLQNGCRTYHISKWVAVYYCLTVIGISSFAIAQDANVAQLTGNWHGTFKHDGQGRMAVGLTIKESETSGGMEYLLHYGDPRSCRLMAKYAGVEDDVYYFRFNEASGGDCDKLYKGEMSLRLDGNGDLEVTVQRRQIKETLKLHK